MFYFVDPSQAETMQLNALQTGGVVAYMTILVVTTIKVLAYSKESWAKFFEQKTVNEPLFFFWVEILFNNVFFNLTLIHRPKQIEGGEIIKESILKAA